MGYTSVLFNVVIFMTVINSCLSLECYVCDNQDNNKGKCVKTIKTCEQGEDVCLTEIKWGSMPYWQQGALKQLYISKRCSTKDKCEWFRQSNMNLCSHIWYEDWKCSECCKGDRCNYFIMSGADHKTISIFGLIVSTVGLYLLR